MFDQAISSLKFNFKERVTNPLIGTMITVWTFHNWDIVYTFFNFDKGQTLNDKLEKFHHYWDEHCFWCNMGVVLLYSFGILFVMYLLLSLSALLQTIYDRTLLPKAKHIWKGDKVQFQELISMEKNRDFYQDKYEKARSVKNGLVIERDEFQQKYDETLQKFLSSQETEKQLRQAFENAQVTIKNQNNILENNKSQFQKYKNDILVIQERNVSNLDFKFIFKDEYKPVLSSDKYKSLLRSLRNEFDSYEIESVFRQIVNQNTLYFKSDKVHRIAFKCIQLGLVYSDEMHLINEEFRNYPLIFTDLGKEFYNKFSTEFPFR